MSDTPQIKNGKNAVYWEIKGSLAYVVLFRRFRRQFTACFKIKKLTEWKALNK